MVKQIVGIGKKVSVPLLPPDSSEPDEGVSTVEARLVSRVDGSEVDSWVAHPVVTPGVAVFTIPAPADLDVQDLVVSWVSSDGLDVVSGCLVEVVGSYLVRMSAIRSVPKLDDRSRFPDADLVRERDFVESRFESVSGLWFRDQIVDVAVPPGSEVRLSPTVFGLRPVLLGSSLRSDRSVPGGVTIGDNCLAGAGDSLADAWLAVSKREDVPPALEDALAEWVADRVVLGGKKRSSRAKTVSTRQGTYEMPDESSGPSGIPAIDAVLVEYMFQGFS